MRRWMWTVLVILTGCSARETSLWLDLPPHDGKRSLLIAAPESDSVSVDAFDLTENTTDLEVSYPVEALSGGAIEAMLYEDSLFALNIPKGTLERASRLEDEAALPDPDESFRAAIDLDTPSSAWESTTGLSERLQGFRFAEPLRCSLFGPTSLRGEVEGDVNHAIRVGPDRALVGTVHGGTHFFGGLGLTPAFAPMIITAMYRHGEDGPLWIGDPNGNVYRAEVDDRIHSEVLSGAIDPGRVVVSITGAELENGELELFAMTATSSARLHSMPRIFRYDGNSWSPFATLPGDTVGDLVAVGPGRVFVRSTATGTIFEVSSADIDQSFFGSEVTLTSLDMVQGTGAVVGSAQGRFFRRDGLEWRAILGDYSYGWWSLAAAGLHGNVIFLIASGALGEVDYRGRRCDENATLGIIENGVVLRLSDEAVLVTGTTETNDVRHTRLAILPVDPR